MIHVCDAIMGSGKSQSAITYMNEHSRDKFVYITPYLDEADRIKKSCEGMNFQQPSDKLPQSKFSKLEHTRQLLSSGENITSTHASFRMYTKDMLESIANHGYTLIVDEAVEGFTESKHSPGDIQMLARAGYIVEKDGAWEYTGEPYTGKYLGELFKMLKCNNIVMTDEGGKDDRVYFWALPCEVMGAFKDVFILTYLFEAQDLRYYLQMNNMPFEYIGIRRDGDVYRFSATFDYTPEYVSRIGEMIHIFDNEKLNSIGKSKHALSDNWYKRSNSTTLAQLKNHINNYLRNYMKAPSSRIMWATFKNRVIKMAGRGYKNQHVVLSAKATNEYRDRDVLAYAVNIFIKPNKVQYFAKYDIKYDIDAYALSVMLQWIWRSAIRDGKEIWIYIPSSRMRKLLQDWITKTQEEYASRTNS